MHETILIIEDDHQIRRVVEGYLQQAGYHVLTAADGELGLALAQREKPALLILDLMLPGLDGWEITRRLRGSNDPAVAELYIIMLTARVEETDRIVGLELGADDYVPKPFSPRELVARVRAALRRLEGPTANAAVQLLEADDLRLDPTYRTVTLADMRIDLTSTEFDLLHYLMRNPGRPFSRDQLLDTLQSTASDDIAYERTIDAHIKNLRQKLGESGRNSRFIETVHGIGYRFTPAVTRPTR
ncbi:MAG: response regulator transcription factor [Caldilineaceae bacterium]